MATDHDLPLPADVEKRRQVQALEYLAALLAATLMMEEEWDKEDLQGVIRWTLNAKAFHPERIQPLMNLLVKMVESHLETQGSKSTS
jgi:hypothetical protein